MVDTEANFTPSSLTHKDTAMLEATPFQLQQPTRSVPDDDFAVNCTVPLTTAISTPAPFNLTFGEAERQLRYLTSISSRKSQTPRLRTYYRDLFINSTTELDDQIRLNLLIICLAYKTRDAVLAFLSLLNEDYPWASVLAKVVEEKGRDSAELVEAAGQPPEPTSASPNPSSSSSFFFFILPTLPFAYPSLALYIWAQFASLSSLTFSAFLSYPSTALLSLSPSLLSLARAEFVARWPPKRPGMQELWTHLSSSRELLVGWAGQEVRVSKGSGGGRKRGGRTGHAREEVEEWLEAFRRGRGEEVRMKEREGAKRVEWREELVHVRWIEGGVGRSLDGEESGEAETEAETETETEADGDGDVVMTVG